MGVAFAALAFAWALELELVWAPLVSLDPPEAASPLPLPVEDEEEGAAGCWLLAALLVAASTVAKGEPPVDALPTSFALDFAGEAAGAGAAIAVVEIAAKQKIRIEPILTKQRPDQFFRGGIPWISG